MPSSKSRSELLFHKPWFTRSALNGIRHALHGKDEEAQENEDFLINQFILHMLERERAAPNFRHSGALSFYGFCQRNIHHSYSQILQDLWVLYMLGEKREGFFVEFGACDGKSLSNTLLLEERYGWNGILAEPNPVWHEALMAARKAAISKLCVDSESGRKIPFLSTDKMPELSRVSEIVPEDSHEKKGNRDHRTEIEVDTISLLDLLVEHNAPSLIDYMSIDTEGSEYHILKEFDFDSYSFRLITVEHAGETKKRKNLRTLLEGKGYHNWTPALTRWDDWYIGPKFDS